MLLVSSPHIHCGRRRSQKPPPEAFSRNDCCERQIFKTWQSDSCSGNALSDSNLAKTHYYYASDENECSNEELNTIPFDQDHSRVSRQTVVRMEDYTLVDCTRHGGNNALTADCITRALVVMCDGHGSLSMIGQAHANQVHLGGAEMARLAAHSLANELYLPNSSIADAFQRTSNVLLRYSFEGAARHSLLRQSLLDGAYFQWLASLDESGRANYVKRDTIVSKTCELRPTDSAPTIRYVTQCGEKIDPIYGTTATVVECLGQTIRACNVGDTLVALFTPQDDTRRRKVSDGSHRNGVQQSYNRYDHIWLTESHSVRNPTEVKRMRQKHNTRLASDRFLYKVHGGGASVDAHSVPKDREVCRLSRSLGHQCLRSQGMVDTPSPVLVQEFARGQIAVVATSGIWAAYGERSIHTREEQRNATSIDDSDSTVFNDGALWDENQAATLIGQILAKETSHDPNVLADSILTGALQRALAEADNMSVVVLTMV